MKDEWEWYHTFSLAALIVITGLSGMLIPVDQIRWTWLLTLAAMVLFTMLVSFGITGRFWLGWLINEQYRMSLSRLQMLLWTVVVLSAYFVAVLANISAGHVQVAVQIAIPEELWLALGISVTSLVGSPMIMSQKKKKKTNTREAEKTAIRLGLLRENDNQETKAEVINKCFIGHTYQHASPDDARLYDLVRGEETSNADILDLTRFQNLFFTLILVGVYAASLGGLLGQAVTTIEQTPIQAFPELGTAFVALMGISHAGYLVAKAVDSQPEGPE